MLIGIWNAPGSLIGILIPPIGILKSHDNAQIGGGEGQSGYFSEKKYLLEDTFRLFYAYYFVMKNFIFFGWDDDCEDPIIT